MTQHGNLKNTKIIIEVENPYEARQNWSAGARYHPGWNVYANQHAPGDRYPDRYTLASHCHVYRHTCNVNQYPHPPTATATFTPSLVATDAPSGESIFTHADFIYNGDGQRVKSVMATNIAVTTTYFVGAHYEVANGVVTKYYFAGSQRIAIRQDGDLKFLFGDHLGSTSLVTDANGQDPIEIRYTAWGEVRYVSDTSPTNYTYTGQYSYTADFGLMFYNARFYSPYINHFIQPDSIIPNPSDPQSWNR